MYKDMIQATDVIYTDIKLTPGKRQPPDIAEVLKSLYIYSRCQT